MKIDVFSKLEELLSLLEDKDFIDDLRIIRNEMVREKPGVKQARGFWRDLGVSSDASGSD